MAEASTTFHESPEQLSAETMERHRGIVSLMEELEAMDWYAQRIDATADDNLRAILIHNGDEEKEHAMMTLEWLRRRDPVLDEQMRAYLFSDGDIVAEEAETGVEQISENNVSTDGSLGVGSLRENV